MGCGTVAEFARGCKEMLAAEALDDLGCEVGLRCSRSATARVSSPASSALA